MRGSMTARSSRVWTSTRTRPEPASYCTLPASPPSGIVAIRRPRGVDHGLDAAGLVGDEDVALDRVVGEPVGIVAGRRAGDHRSGLRVDREGLVRVGRRGEDATERGHRDHAVDAGGGDRLDDLAACARRTRAAGSRPCARSRAGSCSGRGSCSRSGRSAPRAGPARPSAAASATGGDACRRRRERRRDDHRARSQRCHS